MLPTAGSGWSSARIAGARIAGQALPTRAIVRNKYGSVRSAALREFFILGFSSWSSAPPVAARALTIMPASSNFIPRWRGHVPARCTRTSGILDLRERPDGYSERRKLHSKDPFTVNSSTTSERSTKRAFNFNAGPGALPLPVLERMREELLDYRGTGMSVMEMSHRSPEFEAISD